MPRDLGQRAGLTRAAVLAEAGRIASEEGLASLTIRTLANNLDVAPNAVYGWVDSKAALLDALVDEALCGVVPGAEHADHPVPATQEGIREFLLTVFDAMMTRPELAPLFLSRAASPGPNATAIRRVTTGLLIDSGLPNDRALQAVPVLLVQVMGFAVLLSTTHGSQLVAQPTSAPPRNLVAEGVGWLVAGIMGELDG